MANIFRQFNTVNSVTKNQSTRNCSNQRTRGFTIVELLVVIVVIGILATIAIISFNGIKFRAHDTANESNANGILKIAESHRAANGAYPSVYTLSIGNDPYGNEASVTRFHTAIANAPDALYRNPAAPDWAGYSLVLNVSPVVNQTATPFDNWDRSISLPAEIPGGYASWDDFNDAMISSFNEWALINYAPSPDDPPEVVQQQLNNFLTSYPQFSCFFSPSGCDQSATVQRVIEKEWMYFLNPLVSPSYAEETLCINANADVAKITGYQLKYYSSKSQDWKSKKTGSGAPGNFVTCAM